MFGLSPFNMAYGIESGAAEDKLSQKFEEYFKKLTNEDLDNLVPPTSFAKSGSVAQKMILREMFAKGEVK